MAAPPLPPLLGALLVMIVLGAPSSAARALFANARVAGTVVRLGVLLPERNVRYPWAWPRVQPALSLAREALQPLLSRQGLRSVRLAFAANEEDDEKGDCQSKVTPYSAISRLRSHVPDVLLGVGCPLESFSYYLLLGSLPLLRAGVYQKSSESIKTVYAGPTGPNLSAFLAQLLGHFNWTSRAAFVFSAERDYWPDSNPDLWSLEEELADTPNFTARLYQYQQPDQTVTFIQANGRVVYIFGFLEMLQEVMHMAQAQNMTTGDYVFLYVDIWGESLRAEGHREAAKPWQSKESQDAGGLREAFQTVLVVTPHEPQTPEYRRFQSQLILRAQRDFGLVVNDSLGTLVAGCFHDVLLMYLKAVSETVQEGGHKENTSRILEKMRGQKFQGVTGMVSLNSNYERETDFDLWAMKDVETGEYQVVGHYMGSEKWINWTGPIHWKKGGPPLDNPPCVFDMDEPSCGKIECVQGSEGLDLTGLSALAIPKPFHPLCHLQW
ncbi:atrial natriuretic peptide receptor 2-like [Heteronotia binoei]|uniref:atrial natriuretic peptide receptor 2-like n=1 Tax=Heteronotia binoei TaxID=13085 RepID=UPI00292EC247|nr:atrial natriuretic peptide receptor 2-like [Heteronotia binoei]